MPVLRNIGLLAQCLENGPQDALSEIPNAAVAWDGQTISWVGKEVDIPENWVAEPAIDARGCLVVPGLVDCHTHLAFGGWRADEFVQRIRGTSYLAIARAGGGIQRTVRDTRSASAEQLLNRSKDFLDGMARLGVTTVEAKSGYGLSLEGEIRQLEVYQRLREEHPVRIVPTFLAHTIPSEYRACRDEFVALILDDILPEVQSRSLAAYCDAFVESGAFSVKEAARIFEKARDLGFGVKVHADQISDSGGASLAARFGAVSADHLEFVSDEGIRELADAGTVAVSLPFATLYLGAKPMPARSLIDGGVPVAVATDFNPGSAPSYHLPFAMSLACLMQRMTPNEVLKGATVIAARAIGLARQVGSIEVGKSADMALVDAEDVSHWLYHLRENAVSTTIIGGHVTAACHRASAGSDG